MDYTFIETKETNKGIEKIPKFKLSKEQKKTRKNLLNNLIPKTIEKNLSEEGKKLIKDIKNIITLYTETGKHPIEAIKLSGKFEDKKIETEEEVKKYITNIKQTLLKDLIKINKQEKNNNLNYHLQKREEDPEKKHKNQEEARKGIYNDTLKENAFYRELLKQKASGPLCLDAKKYRKRIENYEKRDDEKIIFDVLSRGESKAGKNLTPRRRNYRRSMYSKGIKKIDIRTLKPKLDKKLGSLKASEEKNVFLAHYKNEIIKKVEESYEKFIKQYTQETSFDDKKAKIDELMEKLNN